jgi:hypothetical protein
VAVTKAVRLMNDDIWRFYTDADRRWRWQRRTADDAVLAESAAGYGDYDSCVAAAREAGYVFQASQEKLRRLSSR